MTHAIPLLPRDAMELDSPGWLDLFQVAVADGCLLLLCAQLEHRKKRSFFAARDTIEPSRMVAIAVGTPITGCPPQQIPAGVIHAPGSHLG
jgi:hypothetical protein